MPGGEANVDDLIAGFIQAIKGDSSAMKMNPQQAQQYLQTYFVEAQAREAKKTKEEGKALRGILQAKIGPMKTTRIGSPEKHESISRNTVHEPKQAKRSSE